MADASRIAKTFYKHQKAVKARNAEPGSISLWLFANCWCRNHRRQGFIPREKALELGTEAEIQALVDSGLWLEVDDGYQFNDWAQWNPDLLRNNQKSSAAWLVQQNVPDHPYATQHRLAGEVAKLIDEGITTPLIVSGLKKWRERPSAPVTWLAYFVSDAVREGQTGLAAAIREAKETGKVSGLAEFGHRWQAPDPPHGATVQEIRDFMRREKLAWIERIERSVQQPAS